MLTQSQARSARRRRSASISLVLIASTAMIGGCDRRAAAGDVAYRDSFRTADDCRRDYGDNCSAAPGGYYHGPYIINSGGRPAPTPNAVEVERVVLSGDTASRINSGAEASRGGFTSRGGFGGEGGGHGGGE